MNAFLSQRERERRKREDAKSNSLESERGLLGRARITRVTAVEQESNGESARGLSLEGGLGRKEYGGGVINDVEKGSGQNAKATKHVGEEAYRE